MSASAFQVALGEPVGFTATAHDLNGDDLAYFWNLAESQFLGGTNRASRAWIRAGDYVVRCEVSDLKGGLDKRHSA